MASDVHLHIKDGVDTSDAMVVIGAPTLGVVGTITTRYLIDRLDLELIGGLRSDQFPPVSLVDGGRASLPVRLYERHLDCGPELACQRLIVLTTEFLTGVEMIHGLSASVTRWAAGSQAELVVVPDGLLVPPGEDEGQAVQGVASSQAGLELLGSFGIEPMGQGMISGLSAAMLYDGEIAGVDTLCLLSATAPDHPDARAAARVVSVLDQLIPEIDIGTQPLIEEAEAIEAEVQALREQMASHGGDDGSPASPSMYT